MPSPIQRKANNALGICGIALLFLFETAVADYKHPNPASPYVWSVLGAVAVGALWYYLRHNGR